MAFQGTQEQGSLRFLAGTNSSINLRDVKDSGSQAVSVFNKLCKQLSASVVGAQGIDENRCVEQEVHCSSALIILTLSGSMLAIRPQFPHPLCRSAGQFGMVLIFPCRFFTVQELQESFAANLVSRGFDKKSTASAGADESVDLPNQVFRKQNVGSLARHMLSVPSIVCICKAHCWTGKTRKDGRRGRPSRQNPGFDVLKAKS